MLEGKRKIGILTFHCANNYGAVLQAYALGKTLEKIKTEKEVCVIDYRCRGTIAPTSFTDIKRKKGYIGALLHYNQIKRMNSKFDAFRQKHLHLTKAYRTVDELAGDINEFDAVISGSDQVWNLQWSDGDTVYFQDFHNQNYKKCSYAASFGFTTLEESKVDFYKAALSDFSAISVREKSGKEIIEKQLGLSAIQNIDPTLLLSAADWSEIAQEPNISKKYILVYMVPKQESIIKYALCLKEKTGFPIIMLSKNLRPLNALHRGDSSPEEYVGWFKNAEYVVTNSFHGTAFSCIFKKNLWIDLNTERGFNTRSKNLIELCGLEHRVNMDGTAEITGIDWIQAEHVIIQEKLLTEQYLKSL